MVAIVTREVGATAKGSPLSNAEVDNNFINLNNGKLERNQHHFYVKNTSGVTINKGNTVMATGVVGGSPQMTAAKGDLSTTPTKYMLGLAMQDIANNEWGWVADRGLITEVNTNAWPANTVLYYDPTTPGGLTSVEPTGIRLEVAFVLIQGNGNGALEVRQSLIDYDKIGTAVAMAIALG